MSDAPALADTFTTQHLLFKELAHRLLDLQHDASTLTGTKARQEAAARCDGFVDAAHLMLRMANANIGAAPFAVVLDALDVLKSIGPRPGQTSGNQGRKSWYDHGTALLLTKWGLL